MSGYEPPPPPQARGLRLGDLVRRRPIADPDDEEPAFPVPRRDDRASDAARDSRGEGTEEQAPSWRTELRERRRRQEASDREAAAERGAAAERTAQAEAARRTTERETAKDARPERRERFENPDRGERGDGRDGSGGRDGAERRDDAERSPRLDKQRAEPGDGAKAEQRQPDRPTVRHVLKPRDPGRHNVPAPPVEPARKKPWRKVTKSATGAATAGVTGAADTAGTGAPAGAAAAQAAPSWYSRRKQSTAGGAAGPGGASGAGNPGSAAGSSGGNNWGLPQVQPGSDSGHLRGPFSGLDLIMLIPAGLAAYYGAGMFVLCAEEAGGRASFFLWLMIGFWIVIVSAKWPLLRLMRWAWVLAGLMAAASIPIGGG